MTKWEFRRLVRQHQNLLGRCCPLGAVLQGALGHTSRYDENPSPYAASSDIGLLHTYGRGVSIGWDTVRVEDSKWNARIRTWTSQEMINGARYAHRLRKVYLRA